MRVLVEPFGELAVDVLHEAGDVEEVAVELEPLSGAPVAGFQLPASSEAESGSSLQFAAIEWVELLEMNDRVVVIPHQLEGSESAEVESQVELEEGEEFSCDAASVEGEIAGMTGDAVQEVIEGGVLAFVSGGSGHGVVSCSRDGRWRDLKHTTLLWTKNDGETKSARFSDSQKLRKVRSNTSPSLS